LWARPRICSARNATKQEGHLAVDKSVQGQGLGAYLLVDALARVDRADRDLGIHAIEVVAIDDAAKGFYLKYGFTELTDDPHHLFISMKTVRRLRLA
jgi:GNAT superfamily N-acetyltransferase